MVSTWRSFNDEMRAAQPNGALNPQTAEKPAKDTEEDSVQRAEGREVDLGGECPDRLLR